MSTIHGIDVSAYQSATYSTSGLDFVFTKITEGLSYINPRWAAQRDRAKSAGLVWGAYHYPHMANDPVAEADFFLKQVAWKPGDVIVLDWEGYDAANKGVSKSRQLAYRDAWLKRVKASMPGHRVGMYCNADYWLNVDKTSNCGDFLWIATAGKAAGQPGIDHPWTFHQYSTAGGIDHDVANFPSRAALAAWAGSQKEDDVAFTKADVKTLATTDDVFKAPADAADYATNKYWTLATHVEDQTQRIRATQKTVNAMAATIKTLAGMVGSGVDTAAVVTAVENAIAEAVVHVDVDVTGPKTQEA